MFPVDDPGVLLDLSHRLHHRSTTETRSSLGPLNGALRVLGFDGEARVVYYHLYACEKCLVIRKNVLLVGESLVAGFVDDVGLRSFTL